MTENKNGLNIAMDKNEMIRIGAIAVLILDIIFMLSAYIEHRRNQSAYQSYQRFFRNKYKLRKWKIHFIWSNFACKKTYCFT